MIIKKQTNKIQKRYYIDKKNRIIKETKLKNITLSEVIIPGEIYELNKLSNQIKDMEINQGIKEGINENNNQ